METAKRRKQHTTDIPEEHFLSAFDRYLKRSSRSDHTRNAYRVALCQYFNHYDQVTIRSLQAYRADLIAQYRPASANQKIHAWNQYLRFLEEEEPDACPELRGYRLKAIRQPKASFQDSIISDDDCRLLERCLKADGHLFWYFVVRFLVTTGVRVSELTQIKIEHLSLGYLDLYSKGGRVRRIYMTDALCEEALAWCHASGRTSGFLFARRGQKPVTARGVHERMKHFAERYGIAPETVYPHSFRHRFAKNFLSRSGDIALLADLLGHESIETTRIYLTSSSREQREMVDEVVTW